MTTKTWLGKAKRNSDSARQVLTALRAARLHISRQVVSGSRGWGQLECSVARIELDRAHKHARQLSTAHATKQVFKSIAKAEARYKAKCLRPKKLKPTTRASMRPAYFSHTICAQDLQHSMKMGRRFLADGRCRATNGALRDIRQILDQCRIHDAYVPSLPAIKAIQALEQKYMKKCPR